ncbi:transporter [Halocynthiibacter sp. C4]|uniref:transporter n=1 Tax=Halocynthiibacter sp. C4 TaxID=2992758 RepID=UPI00237A6CD6|nr:transporter [Halocynthiibacter sp. C4]MDE0588313.1 transporter [Halocynthiibacter sp. C4]
MMNLKRISKSILSSSMAKKQGATLAAMAALILGAQGAAAEEESASELAQTLSNPVASLISAPFQLNYNENYGPNDDGSNWTLNVQPVIPFDLSDDWNLISRTIVPLQLTDGIPSGAGSEFGVGDVVQSFFFSPKAPTSSGWIWGAGPVVLVPTSRWNDGPFGLGEWGLGATGVALRISGGWTYGALANHIWDVGGETEISSTFMQPFLVYTWPNAWGAFLNTESTYDWTEDQWSVPINFGVSKVVNFGKQPVSLSGGLRYWAESTPTGPEGWGARFTMTFMFPK